MRVLFTVQPEGGHLHPITPLALALQNAGHEVVVCSAPRFGHEVEAFGLRHVATGLDWLADDFSTWTAFPPMPPPGPEFVQFVVTVFADITTDRMVPDLLAFAQEWRPDLVIREGMEYSGALVAEKLDIPHASIAGNGLAALDSPSINYLTGNRSLVGEPMARHRAKLGLPADPQNLMPFRHLVMAFMPPEWDGDGASRPANIEFFRHTSAEVPGARIPDYMETLDDRPLVLASLGTVFNGTPGVLDSIVEGLAGEPINLIVVLGPGQESKRFGTLPSNVHLEEYVAQVPILRRCDLFVTHGGFNSVKEALIEGVPLVATPITADQPYNAQRAGALGLAEVVSPEDRTATAVRDAVRLVLANPSYRAKAAEFRERMLALPGPDQLLRRVEALAHERSNSPAGAR